MNAPVHYDIDSIAAVVILFNPDKQVAANIGTYVDHVKYLYVIDNSGDSGDSLDIAKYFKSKTTTILYSGENIGIAKGLNIALKQAKKDGIEWLMTMDQDSSFFKVQLSNYLTAFEIALQENELSIFSLQHNKSFYFENNCRPYYSVDIVMTSGSIVNTQQALTIKGFDEELFIDEVDHEFCYRLTLSGGTVLETNCAYLKHHLGTLTTNFFGFECRAYPVIRLYYMVRNHLYIKRIYGKSHPHIIRNRQKYIYFFALKQIVNSKKPWQYIIYIWKGFRDYKQNNMGRYH